MRIKNLCLVKWLLDFINLNLNFNISCILKMSYYFKQCCFDSERLGVRNECNRLSCASGKHD